MSQQRKPIAVIGSGCRFPGEATTSSKLWELLSKPRDVLSKIPTERFDPEGFYHSDGLHHGSSNVLHSYVLSEDARLFDASFFQIKPIEANSIDPQQRLLLEVVYESIDSAGIALDGLRGSNTAVYVGQMCADYNDILTRDTETMPTYFATGTSRAIMSNRVSYFFDWHGPSMTIDTACSSSLVAVHQAVQTLRSGESRVAIAAGANLLLGPEPYIAESKLKMLSADGRSRMWDDGANGYARGDGIASVVLKTLDDALEDGDYIECIIRETGVNQDGRTKGITMPSSASQAALIRDTYARAGLDVRRKEDRPQYFEAHGTGTKAGDPQEAEAIHSAFFGKGEPSNDCLHVGSIKTIIGHTEGTAGIAGLMKASLALQNSIIPPNMLFNVLNPDIKPFWDHLQIPTSGQEWPEIGDGQPRRASVNSFGFGGTNAHAILESYTQPTEQTSQPYAPAPVFSPFVFSAASERSLGAMLESYASYLASNSSVNLHDLSYTLHSRRTIFPVKASFTGQNAHDLSVKLAAAANLITDKEKSPAIRTTSNAGRILGVFTGQGAQWPAMGRALIQNSEWAESRIDQLERTLASLPEADRPKWSLKQEMLSETARLDEAELAQPLSTAVQILAVDALKQAGIKFDAVIGHSSGEIAAAFAAGFISAPAAICISYYRGVHTKGAGGADGQQGSMLAAGTSMEDAQELCELPNFEGRLAVAASNSSSSVTLSGDLDAIQEAKEVFEEEKKFVRVLKVNKAYHSHHMIPCSDPYGQALEDCDFDIETPDIGCTWFSSLYNGRKVEASGDLKRDYWVKNMLNPVLFSQALESALDNFGSFDIAIEVGPHPALKGPATSTIREITSNAIPYVGVLSRGRSYVESFAEALGSLWVHLGQSTNLAAVDTTLAGVPQPKLLKGLPSYSWEHDRLYFHESRAIKSILTRPDRPHELLGVRSPDETDQIQWRNFLRPSEVSWLKGHQLQGQTVFPAAGYASMALEAAMSVVGINGDVKLIEIEDLAIGRPLTFDDDNTGIETIFTLSKIVGASGDNRNIITAEFTCHSPASKESDSLAVNASGEVRITLGEAFEDTLPPRDKITADMLNVDSDRFYGELNQLGYDYSGPFKALNSLKRYLDLGAGSVSSPAAEGGKPLLVHPAMLDAAFQSVFLAYAWPGDGRLWSLHVPNHIRRIKVNPILCESGSYGSTELPFQSASEEDPTPAIHGHIDIFDKRGQNTMIQVEDIKVVPFATPTAADDRYLFASEVWGLAAPDSDAAVGDTNVDQEDIAFGAALQRVARFYLKNLDKQVSHDERIALNNPPIFKFISKAFAMEQDSESEKNQEDSDETIGSLINKFSDNTELRLMRTVGKNLPAAIRGNDSIIESMREDGSIETLLANNGFGVNKYNRYLGRMVRQLTHIYPHLKILEIGARNGGATQAVFDEIGTTFLSYTYTDVSPEFLELSQEKFRPQSSRMLFKTLDIEKDVVEQGFHKNSYDLVIASQALHNSSNLEEATQNIRNLLKPAGYLLMAEVTDPWSLRFASILGGFPIWTSESPGREYSPFLTPTNWHGVLRKSGFSGVDSITPNLDKSALPFSIIASQAVDEHVNVLRRPLSNDATYTNIPKLAVVGGINLDTAHLVDELSGILARKYASITTIESLEDLETQGMSPMSTTLCLTELDQPVFKSLSRERFDGLKQLFDQSKNVLWIHRNPRSGDPYCNAMVGFARTLQVEMPHVNLQFLDVGESVIDPQILAELILRLQAYDALEDEGALDKMLWSKEPELVLDNGKILVPRVIPNQGQNDRYNSARRSISRTIDPEATPVSLSIRGTSYSLVTDSEYLPDPSSQGNYIGLQVRHSLLLPIKFHSAGPLFIVIGSIPESGESVLALSETQGSIVNVQEDRVLHCSVPSALEARVICSLAIELLVHYLVWLAGTGTTIVAHNPDTLTATLLSEAASKDGVTLFTTSTDVSAKDSTDLLIHPNASTRSMKHALPTKPALFVDFTYSSHGADTGARMIESLHPQCRNIRVESLFNNSPTPCPNVWTENVSDVFEKALSHLSLTAYKLGESEIARVVTLKELAEGTAEVSPASVIQWTDSQPVQIRIQPAESLPLFQSDKSYLLVGLTGGLGQSLCEWMVAHGARYLVLTSRSPNLDKDWVSNLRSMGAVVEVITNDITNKKSVQLLYDEVTKSYPPVAGVANGAMVLHDTSIYDMDAETMLKVLRPKIDGSRYLDEVFQDNTLDFFILFSSLTCACGNSGQANYTTANMFMAGLAAHRKSRGLAASVIDIGAMMGIGVLVRDRSYAVQEHLRDLGYLWMSERDFHHSFSEAILAGRPENNENPEVMAGLRLCKSDNIGSTQWAYNPRFSHCVLHVESAEDDSSTSKTKVPLRTRLAMASNHEEITELLQDAFLSKIRAALSLDSKQEDATFLSQSADELGVDSLVAVDIRSWWLKEAQVDMPVLKILGGTSIKDLVAFAQEKIPSGFSGSIKTAPEATSESSKEDTEHSMASDNTTPESSAGSPISTPRSEDEKYDLKLDLSKLAVDRPSVTAQRREIMSYGQSRFWFLGMYLDDPTTFNIVCSIQLTGNLRVHDLSEAVLAVGNRHEALRTFLYAENGQPMQGILETSPLTLEKKSVANDNEVNEEFENLKNYAFDIESGESMRIALLSQSPRSHHLLVAYHHINMDGISLQVLLSDLEKAYCHQRLTKPMQYADFAMGQRRAVADGLMAPELKYWKNELAELPPPLPILSVSNVTSRRPLERYSHHRVDFKVESNLGASIKQTSRNNKATAFHFYLATFKALLYRFTEANDMCIGVADGNRNHEDVGDSIGFFLNLLPLRLQAKGNRPFKDTLNEARLKAYSALSNSRLPFDVLLEELKVPRSPMYNPIFQAFVNYRQGAQESLPFGNCKLQGEQYEVGRTAYDISLDVIENAGGEASVMLLTQQGLYTQRDTELLAKSFQVLLKSFAHTPSQSLDDVNLFDREYTDNAIKLSKGISLKREWPSTLVHRIEEITLECPQNSAVKDGYGKELTYSQMATRVNSIASALLEANTSAGSRIAVYQQPSVDWICSLLAIMRVGAIYVPLDLRSPVTRLNVVLKDCKPAVILAHAETIAESEKLESQHSAIVNVSTLSDDYAGDIRNSARSDSPALILYTSGSTGTPKGVIIGHSALANKIEESSKRFNIHEGKVLQQSAFTFDFSVWQMFMALSTGGMVYMVPKSKRGDAVSLVHLLFEENISHTVATPSEYISWLRYGAATDEIKAKLVNSPWKTVFVGGEQAPEALKHEFRVLDSEGLHLHNIFGPSEITIYSHTIEIDYRDLTTERVPVGYPSDNYSAFVVDENLEPVPVGVPGEILTTGAGVSLGYLNNTELTSEKFIPNNFATEEYKSNGWTTAFRTGDKGRLLPGGVLVFEGRITGDTQIKLRGLRIELKDIEATILEASNSTLEEVVVSVREEGQTQFLVAHAVFSPSYKKESNDEKAQFLQKLPLQLPLPQYMCPAVIVQLDQIPLNAHGKVDRLGVGMLPIPDNLNDRSTAPSLNETESKLKSLWEDILTPDVAKFYTIGPDTDFFHVGGNSLLLIGLQRAIKEKHDILLPLFQLFEASTLASMAARIENSVSGNPSKIDWEKETRPSSELTSPDTTTEKPKGTPRIVVLTGSTGFLGKALLRQLIKNEAVEKVHCIAVRSPERLSGFSSSPKVIVHTGDLGSSLFGLSPESCESIFTESDTIIHNGADVSFMKSYTSLRRTNVNSTKQLVQLAIPRDIPIHYISTVTVGQYTGQSTFAPVSVSEYYPPVDGRDGYGATKWASERYLEHIHASYGLPVAIHRPSTITGSDAPALDIMPNLMKFSQSTKCVPVSGQVQGYLDFISVENVASGILTEVASDPSTFNQVKYFHLAGETSFKAEELKDYLEKKEGVEYQGMSFTEWADVAVKAGMDFMVGDYVRGLDELKSPIVFPRLI